MTSTMTFRAVRPAGLARVLRAAVAWADAKTAGYDLIRIHAAGDGPVTVTACSPTGMCEVIVAHADTISPGGLVITPGVAKDIARVLPGKADEDTTEAIVTYDPDGCVEVAVHIDADGDEPSRNVTRRPAWDDTDDIATTAGVIDVPDALDRAATGNPGELVRMTPAQIRALHATVRELGDVAKLYPADDPDAPTTAFIGPARLAFSCRGEGEAADVVPGAELAEDSAMDSGGAVAGGGLRVVSARPVGGVA